MQDIPLVSIICTVYNQEAFIEDTLKSVFNQSYKRLELLIIDNGSTDNSRDIIEKTLKVCPASISVSIFIHPYTKNYCQSFNQVFKLVKGQYFIDLSGDDLLFANHVEESVAKLGTKPEAWAVFSNVELHTVENDRRAFFYSNSQDISVMDGELYQSVVKGNPVLSVSLVMDALKFRDEGMYDENLVYEDFDLLVRMCRKFPMYYSPHVGVRKAIHNNSFSSNQYKARNSKMLPSTYLVCRKIQQLNQTEEENEALKFRVAYELKMAIFSANFTIAKKFLKLGKELGIPSYQLWFYQVICELQIDLSGLIRLKRYFGVLK